MQRFACRCFMGFMRKRHQLLFQWWVSMFSFTEKSQNVTPGFQSIYSFNNFCPEILLLIMVFVNPIEINTFLPSDSQIKGTLEWKTWNDFKMTWNWKITSACLDGQTWQQAMMLLMHFRIFFLNVNYLTKLLQMAILYSKKSPRFLLV